MENLLEIRGLCKQYPEFSLKDVSFSLPAGSIMGKILRRVFPAWDQRMYEKYLDDFELPKKKKIKEYSKGMKIKLSIASAVSHHPRLMLYLEKDCNLIFLCYNKNIICARFSLANLGGFNWITNKKNNLTHNRHLPVTLQNLMHSSRLTATRHGCRRIAILQCLIPRHLLRRHLLTHLFILHRRIRKRNLASCCAAPGTVPPSFRFWSSLLRFLYSS